ncbi:hypothetical protein E4T39_00714 [Aureobasidium subglaciale]|nr:hypothetical protein E4T39_00714 [Aureobasidium subglaciale]
MASLRYNHNLTLLYNDTKRRAAINVDKQEPSPASARLHRKLHAQTDRLVTWGLEWAEETNDSIDESVERAGFTENVTNVLGNIKDILEQADRLSSCSPGSDKVVFNQDRYQDLLRDLTSSVDVLYDLSASRRAIARGTYPNLSDHPHDVAKRGLHMTKIPFDAASFASSEKTLVNTHFTRPALSPYAGLPASISPQALMLPADGPPPYEYLGIPSTARMMGRLSKSLAPESVRNVFRDVTDEYVWVMVEFENYDSLYRDTGVSPPLTRVEKLASSLNMLSNRGNLRLLGYVEDPQQPRIGLVYDYRTIQPLQSEAIRPVTLMSLILTATQAKRPVDVSNATPFLEDRFRIALRLVEKLRDLHAENYFHGNIHSESIVFLQQGQSPQPRQSELHRPVISAFDMFSRNRIEYGDSPAISNITKHPEDTGGEIDDVTAVRYDLYQIGLVLLEIGLWNPVNDYFKEKYSLKDFKLRLEKLYIPKLASKCGSLYMRAVQTCLRWADNDDVGRVGIEAVYDSILVKLQRCCLLDETEPLEISQIPAGFLQPQGSSEEFNTVTKRRRNISPGRLTTESLELKAAERASVASYPSAISSSVGPRSPILSMLSAKSNRSNSTSADSMKHVSHHTTQTSTPNPASDLDRSAPTTNALSTSGPESFPFSFRDYRRKVVLIQSRWRARKAEARRRVYEDAPQYQSDRRPVAPTSRCRLFPISLPQSIVEEWHSDIGLRLSCIIERALKGSPESSSIDLVSVGHDALTAKPTIIVTCANTARVKAALKRKFHYDRTMFDLKVRQGCVNLSRGKSRICGRGDGVKRSHARGDGSESNIAPLNPFWQERPLCGASIGAYLPDYGHLEPVSLGGIVKVDDKEYGMSVHHMLEPPTDEEDSTDSDSELDEQANQGAHRSSARTSGPVQPRLVPEASDDHGYLSDLSSVSSGGSNEDGYVSSDFESDVSDNEDAGNKPGISTSSSKTVQVTQPAFGDAVAEDLHADDATTEELDEDHLSSYKLGKVYASSGLRRLNQDGRRFEIDWALLELDPPRLQPYNLIQGGRRHCKSPVSFKPDLKPPVCRRSNLYTADEDWYPTEIVPATNLANLEVHCLGRTSGLKTGVIGAAMSFVKIKGRRNFSLSWTVVGDFGVGGDSGAWIVSNNTGQVAGHVLAERTGLTYICAMSLLFQDIQQTLRACRISLPGARKAAAAAELEDVDVGQGTVYTAMLSTREKTSFGDGRKRYYVESASRAKSKAAEAAIAKPRTGWWQSVRD